VGRDPVIGSADGIPSVAVRRGALDAAADGDGVGNSTVAGKGVGVTVGSKIVATGDVIALEFNGETVFVADNVSVTNEVEVTVEVTGAPGPLNGGPVRAACEMSGGGVSGSFAGVFVGGTQFASMTRARMGSARLAATVRNCINGV
jgi:hypothetical protein